MSNVEVTGLVMADETNVVLVVVLFGLEVLHPCVTIDVTPLPLPPAMVLVVKELGHELCLMAAAAAT